jgi:hypothetical protein
MLGKVFVKKGFLTGKCLTVLVFWFIFIGCSSTTPTRMSNKGHVSDVNLETKDFVTMGIIFVTSSAQFDNGLVTSGSIITYEMLMKEAQKLGAEDIANLRIDEVGTLDKDGDGTMKYTATALAIKYVPSVHK